MKTCEFDALTMLLALVSMPIGYFLVNFLSNIIKFFKNFSIQILVPTATAILIACIFHIKAQKSIELVDCKTGQLMNNVSYNFKLTCKNS